MRALLAVTAMVALTAIAAPGCDGSDDSGAAAGGWTASTTQRPSATAAPATPAHPGKQNYVTHCAACHGVNGEGQPNWIIPGPDGLLPAPPHDNTGHTWHHGDGYLFRVTKSGGQAFMLPGQVSAMPGFDVELSDQEIIDVIEYIKGFWGEGEREFQATASQGDPFP